MNWLKRLFGKRKSPADDKQTPKATPEPAASTPEPPTSAADSTEAPTTEPAADSATTESAETTPESTTASEPAAADEPIAEPAVATEPAEASAAAEPAEPTAVAETSVESAAVEPEAEEATDPAMSLLDDVERAAELRTGVEEGPYGPASAKPNSDGAAPSAEFVIKGKESSKLFHTEESPYFGRTKADVWFKSATAAESAGFTAYTRKRATAKK